MLNDPEHRTFAGIYNFISHAGECQDGCRIALFATRWLARKRLLKVKVSFPKATVVKVAVTVRQIGKAGK